MQGRIAIVGYGSLIWDLEILAPWVEGPWRMGEGPAMPLEFSRVSPKRRMGLVVCVDPGQGAPCPSHAIASRRSDVDAARADLAARERAPLARIGWVCLRSGRGEGRIAGGVRDWAAAMGLAGAVWTELDPNFEDHAGVPFGFEAGEAWLLGLAGADRDEAVRYIANAPPATDTPFRRRLAERPWWRAEVARVATLDAAAGAPWATG
ncbi:hypothetical protein P2H44_02225 [Albimonas sp. CAU 1670]|uniref:hypothetical protein n=1 Tax=Albimonas sp. CAU 1670 TaxID=3032599 RepID=UPI0023DB1ABF|nr:hypothetical protein [Albimonas sp. CAU 1670]MDF2231360.1 hypothetical protein [Albimonas sp. CAU 1670]